ncbi:MAG: hypothetical protein KJ687_04870 [Proteobacteria bacterium]|jgi:hypothetical protein|nr:hypothetical protein [Pseudomonadota bacterium]|tara:strand:- start:215 stop:445 length:231 start_codon:yes stop_codon:yes gene_type:complete
MKIENDLKKEWTKHEIEEAVTFVRLELYNRDLLCGPKPIRKRLQKLYRIEPLPSERTIARLLSRNGLTNGRTGIYE